MSKATALSAQAGEPTISVVRGDSDVTLVPWPAFPPEDVESGNPNDHQGTVLFRDPAKRYSVGVWECPPAKFTEPYPGTEMGHVLKGRATLTNAETGESRDIGPGDHFYVAFGSTIIWEVHETVRKLYVMYEEAWDEERFY